MLSKAHLTIGTAAVLTVMMPDSLPEVIPCVFGAAAGCVICDIDCEANEKADASRGRITAAFIAAASLIIDNLLRTGMLDTASPNWPYLGCLGIAVFVITCAFASVSSHRGFSHSLLALALETGSLWLVLPGAAKPFAIAFISHILLDITNKKPVRLLYPLKKGYCTGLFYANRLADKVFTAAGTVWLIAVIALCVRVSRLG